MNNLVKRKCLYAHLSKRSPDVLMIQETHLKMGKHPIFNKQQFPHQYQAPGNGKARGVAILLKNTVRFEETSSLIDEEGRYVLVNGFLDAQAVTLAVLYVRNMNQEQYLTDILSKLETFKTGDRRTFQNLELIGPVQLNRYMKSPTPAGTRLHILLRKTPKSLENRLYPDFGFFN